MKKHVHFNQLSTFKTKKISASANNTTYTLGGEGEVKNGTPDIKYSQIVFIKDAQKIWTHGKMYAYAPTPAITTSFPTNNTPIENTIYNLGTRVNLTIAAVPNSEYETTIYFTAGTGFQMSIPASTKIVGELSAEAGKSYVISILNGVLVMGNITTKD